MEIKNNLTHKKIECLLLFVAAMFVSMHVVSCNSCSDKLPSEMTNAARGETSAEKNARYAQEEMEMSEDNECEDELPDEELSRKSYQDLEQPAPISVGSEIIFFKSQHIVSYNMKTNCPNYVCWRLTPTRLKGGEKRSDTFMGDPVLGEKNRVETTDYSGSGYDRGHMCPAGDNKNDRRAMLETFYMTNICPQVHSLNEGDWRELEETCRMWAKDYGELYICCGPIFDSANPKTIGKRQNVKISVPDRFFKVVLTLGRVPKALGFIYPNSSTNKDMRDYAVPVDEVERITGFDFYPQLPDDLEDRLESECKPSAWGI